MAAALDFLARHGPVVVFFWVLADQLGVPVPAVPLLLAAGALMATGKLAPVPVMGLAILATMLGHAVWYQAGRIGGARIVHLVCRVTLEPDSCVRRTQNLFTRYGARALIVAPLVPGLSAVAQPLAGMSRMPYLRYLAFDAAGAALWVGLYTSLGFAFAAQLERAFDLLARLGGSILLVALAALALYIGWKLLERSQVLKTLRMAQIDPEELKALLDAGTPVLIVDLRAPMDFEVDPRAIPGALRVAPEDAGDGRIPGDREIVLYCS